MSTINSNATGIIETADNTNTLALQTGGTTAVYVDSSQNVGIGTTAGITTVSNGLAINNATAANLPGLEIQTAGITRMYFNANNATSYIASVGTNPLVTYTNGSERMRIDSSGNVGIGTSSPVSILHVKASSPTYTQETGGSVVTGAVSSQQIKDNSGSVVFTQGFAGLNSCYQFGTAFSTGFMRFLTGSAVEAARIDSSGNLLVGQTGQNSTEKFGVTFAAGNAGIYTKVASTATQYHLTFNNGSVVGAISTNGSLTTYSVSSDYRLKDNVVPLTGALEKIAQMKPSLYNYKADPTTQIEGFIAHELQEVVPHAVVGEKDAVDADGNPVYQGVDASFLIPHLVAAVQELTAKLKSAGVAGF